MMFTKRLREGVRRGRITSTIRIWKNARVKLGNRYPMEDGHVVVDSIKPIALDDITFEMARESGFANVEDLLKTAKHGSGDNVYFIRFHYLRPGAWETAPARTGMREKDFRRLALGMEGAVEAAHMGHPDFRVNNRIFATLHDDRAFGMVMLTPGQQAEFIRADPESFQPENGAWGRAGCTRVTVADVQEETLGEAMTLAWQNAVNKGPSKPARKRAVTAAPRAKKRPARRAKPR